MDISIDRLLPALQQGTLVVKGEFVWGSNYTFLVQVEDGDLAIPGVYKPVRGERPLWDFPAASLARREVAAYLVSEALGWELVPPTVFREKAPLGSGSVQLYIEHEPEYHYFNFGPEDVQRLRPLVTFDLLVNNADRKGSHILRGQDGHLWLIDHGLCFHAEDKLRTVVWDFVGEPIPDELCRDLGEFRAKLGVIDRRRPPSELSELAQSLLNYISPIELRALGRRADRLVLTGRFPNPDPSRRPFPWPQI
ncbi:MAG: SCO1664 family protein [Chloroflexota bacterium]